MTKQLFFLVFVFSSSFILSQTTVIDPNGDGGFENGNSFAANGWVEDNPADASRNQWVCDTGATTGFSGTNSAYITNNSAAAVPTHTYNNVVSSVSHLYRDVTFPVGESNIFLDFDWICDGEVGFGAYDYMTIWIVPQSYTPVFGTSIAASGTAPTGNIQVGGFFAEQYTWINSSIQLSSNYAGNNARLVFEWTNDTSLGDNPPIAIDNVSLITSVNTSYCSATSNFTSDYIDDFSTNAGFGSEISNLNSGFTAPGYQDNSSTEIVEQLPGGLVEFTVDFSGTIDSFGFNIWVDWNNDFDFDDADEKVYESGAYITGATDDFTVPGTVSAGSYRMRIRADYFDTDPDPCGAISYGEVEDYTITIAAITCTDDPSNITITNIATTTATINWTASTPIPGVGYEYFVTTNASTPSYAQAPTGTTANTVTTANLTGLSENTTYFVWVRSVCSATPGDSGNWIGPASFTTLVTPPVVTNVTICPGDPSQDLTATAYCSSGIITNTITGDLDVAGPYALTPPWFIVSTDPCAFDPAYNKNYDTFDFQVDTDGVYVFEIDTSLPPDFMGYIVINDPLDPFTYGSCATGTWIAGDDDSGPGLDAAITATLTAGINYTLVTTLALSSSQDTPYIWNVSGAGSIIEGTSGIIQWYTSDTGGSPIGTGSNFDPVGVAGSGLANTNTPGVFSYWAACSTSPSIRTQADFIIGKVWNGTIGNTDWATASNWIPNDFIPTATDCVIIPDTGGYDPVIDGTTNGLGYNLTIENGATLTQQSNSTLTITNTINVETGGTYNILNSASLIQTDNVANTVDGTFTMQRTTNIRINDYVYWSSPVTTFNVENISPLTPNGFLYEWNPSYDRPDGPPPNPVPNDYGRWELASGTMTQGKGYIVRGPTGHTATPSGYTATFNGTINNGNITADVSRGTYTGFGYGGPGNTNVTADDDNWNLIGNPYPSAISAIDFLKNTSNELIIEGSVYLWTHGTDIDIGNDDPFYEDYVYNYNVADYIAYNSSGTSSPSGFLGNIGAGQGFFVLMRDNLSANETITFENNMRSSAYTNNQFYRNQPNSENPSDVIHRIWLDYISPSGQTNTTLVAYTDGATNGEDRMFDASTTTGNGLNIYSLIGQDTYLIQGRQVPFDDTDLVPIGINIEEAGSQTIAINTLQGLFDETAQTIYIEDLELGVIHDLRNSPYLFTSEAGIIEDRFILRYTNNALGIDEFDKLNGISVFENDERIVINSSYELIQSIRVFDVLGRNLFSKDAVNNNNFKITTITPQDQALFLKIELVNGQQKIAKIIF